MRLLHKEDHQLLGDAAIPVWVQDAAARFQVFITDLSPEFPCYFGARAEEMGNLRYTYLDGAEVSEPIVLTEILRRYIEGRPDFGQWSALVVFCRHERDDGPRGLLEDKAAFWNILQFLHDHDPGPWPPDIPVDPEDPEWEFCYAGEPIFVTGHSPFYENRRTRLSPCGLMLVIQTRSNLGGILGNGPTAQAVRRRIRSLITRYDSIPPSPELGVYGDSDSREWRQYWLPDENKIPSSSCPISLHPIRGS